MPLHFPILVVLLTLGCGEADVIRLRLRDGSRLFTQPTASHRSQGGRALLTVCGHADPLPRAVDDESSLCAHVQLDAAALEALPQDAVLRIQGSAVVPANFSAGTRVPFEPGGEHLPAVLCAWASTSCFAEPGSETAVQQVQGELRFEERSAERWRGTLELHVEGAPSGADCVTDAQGADFDVRFETGP